MTTPLGCAVEPEVYWTRATSAAAELVTRQEFAPPSPSVVRSHARSRSKAGQNSCTAARQADVVSNARASHTAAIACNRVRAGPSRSGAGAGTAAHLAYHAPRMPTTNSMLDGA